MTNRREIEMVEALAEARGLGGGDAFEAAVGLMEEADDLNLEDDHDGAEDAEAAARLARDYAADQIEDDIKEGVLSAEDVANWERLKRLGPVAK